MDLINDYGTCVVVPFDQKDFRPVVYGMAILLYDRTVLTCAHVVNAALGPDWHDSTCDPIVHICFPSTEGPKCIKGRIDRDNWYPPKDPVVGQPTDIALINLTDAAPESVGRAILRRHKPDAKVKVYGFPGKELIDGTWQSHPTGEIAEGTVTASLIGGRAQFTGKGPTGAIIEKGFSGAGVFSRDELGIVGMVVVADRDKSRQIAHFITTEYLEMALMPRADLAPVVEQATLSLAVSREAIKWTASKKCEIEDYLRTVANMLHAPIGDVKLVDFLRSVLTDESDDWDVLRGAFGLPRDLEKARGLFTVIDSSEGSTESFIGIIAQRIHILLWRYEATLRSIQGDWSDKARRTAKSLDTLTAPHLPARRPNLLEIAAALRFQRDLTAFAESAPDPTLYAVLRAFNVPLAVSARKAKKARGVALDFIYNHLLGVIDGTPQIDDSSNAWYSVRTGIDNNDRRFIRLLPKVADKFKDIHVPAAAVSKNSPVPEIHSPLVTTSYTLSNIQHIVEISKTPLENDLRKQLHAVITIMLDRLLKWPRNDQLYLASVHHEGLRNYLDYVEDQKLQPG